MSQGTKPVEMPAPQLPNFPTSQDDPFYLDPEQVLPVPPPAEEEPDSKSQPPPSGGINKKIITVPDEEPE